MKGIYRIYSGDSILAEFENMITDAGREKIGAYLAGEISSWADAIAIGSAEFSPLTTDEALGMEFWREDIDFKKYKSQDNEIILRATIPVAVSGRIYEVGVYSSPSSQLVSSRGPFITNFDNSQEGWSGGEDDLNFVRIGNRSLSVPLSGSPESVSSSVSGSFRSFTEDTVFRLGYYANSGATEIIVRFKADDSNYREYSFTPAANGLYSVQSWRIQNFQVIGNVDWNDIYEIEVICDGAGSVVLDSITSIEDLDSDVLISRALVDINNEDYIQKNPLKELQIEYSVEFDD